MDGEARPVLPVAVRRVKPVDALGDAKVESLLQLRVHAVIVAPDQLVPPRPRAEACQQGTRRRAAAGSRQEKRWSNRPNRRTMRYPGIYALVCSREKW